jgi:3-phenylpropionate/trans-cinnamate dioxygenase ferredoxin subunit
MSSWHTVAQVGALAAGEVRGIEVAGVRIALGRDGERYFAVARRCPHAAGDLADGIIARGHLVCPDHARRFSTATGQQDRASEVCLVMYPVRVVGPEIQLQPVPLAPQGAPHE